MEISYKIVYLWNLRLVVKSMGKSEITFGFIMAGQYIALPLATSSGVNLTFGD